MCIENTLEYIMLVSRLHSSKNKQRKANGVKPKLLSQPVPCFHLHAALIDFQNQPFYQLCLHVVLLVVVYLQSVSGVHEN